MARPVVLACMGAAWPGSDASGPVLSLAAITSALGGEFDFLRLARDRPFGAREASTPAGVWRDGARFCAGPFGAKGSIRALGEIPCDLLLLNGVFDRDFTIPALLMRRYAGRARTPALLSPRGEFSVGALTLKGGRKAAFLAAGRRAGLFDTIQWHATSDAEWADIRRVFPDARGHVAPNIRPLLEPLAAVPSADCVLRIAFLGRLSPVKNLDFALRALARVTAPVAFDIHGPEEDAAHVEACRRLAAALPAHVRARFCGALPNAQARDMFAACDLMFLPSRSENFGHAIFEALSCGVPVLIGDATPWRDLAAADAGWDLPLGSEAPFAAVIDALAAMDGPSRARLRAGARQVAERWRQNSDAEARTRAMFHALLKGGA